MKLYLGKSVKKDEFEELNERTKGLPSERILDLGRQYIQERNYFAAESVLRNNVLSEVRGNVGDISRLYHILISELIVYPFFKILNVDLGDTTEGIINKTIECMVQSDNLYSEGKLAKQDLLVVEKLIDEIPFKQMRIANRGEFEKLYCRFKEFCLNAFLEK